MAADNFTLWWREAHLPDERRDVAELAFVAGYNTGYQRGQLDQTLSDQHKAISIRTKVERETEEAIT